MRADAVKKKAGTGKIDDRRKPPYGVLRAPLQQLITAGEEDTSDPPRIPPAKVPGSGENDLGPNKLAKPNPKKVKQARAKASATWGAWWETPAANAAKRSKKRKQA